MQHVLGADRVSRAVTFACNPHDLVWDARVETPLSVQARPSSVSRVVEIDPRTDSRWEAFVSSRPDALVYHHPAWLEVLQRTYGYAVVALAYVDSDDTVLGVLPLCRKRGFLSGRRLSSLPHTPVAGPLAHDPAIASALIEAAIVRARSTSRTQLQIKYSSTELDGLVPGLGRAPWSEAYVMDIPEDSSGIRFGNARNHARVRWAVNKAVKAGVTVRSGEDDADLRRWHDLYLRTMRSHAVPPHPFEFFLSAKTILAPRNLMLLLLAEQGGDRENLLAGSVFFMYGRTIFYAFSALRRDAAHLRPNELIQWDVIHRASAEGLRRYELGGGLDEDPRLAAFKRKWGARPVTRFRYYFPFDESTDGSRRGELYQPETTLRRRLSAGVWRRLPLPVTAIFGRWLYRYA
jgi:Acetyltransferase (GNAT) domain